MYKIAVCDIFLKVHGYCVLLKHLQAYNCTFLLRPCMKIICNLNAFSNDFSLTRAIFFNPLSFLGWGNRFHTNASSCLQTDNCDRSSPQEKIRGGSHSLPPHSDPPPGILALPGLRTKSQCSDRGFTRLCIQKLHCPFPVQSGK